MSIPPTPIPPTEPLVDDAVQHPLQQSRTTKNAQDVINIIKHMHTKGPTSINRIIFSGQSKSYGFSLSYPLFLTVTIVTTMLMIVEAYQSAQRTEYQYTHVLTKILRICSLGPPLRRFFTYARELVVMDRTMVMEPPMIIKRGIQGSMEQSSAWIAAKCK